MTETMFRELIKLSGKLEKAAAVIAYGSALSIHEQGKNFFKATNEKITLFIQTPKRLRDFKSDLLDVKFISLKKEKIFDIHIFELKYQDKIVSLPVTLPAKSIIDSIEKPSFGPGIKNIILRIRELKQDPLNSLLEKCLSFSSKACIKRTAWIIDKLIPSDSKDSKTEKLLKRAKQSIGSGFTLLDTNFPDQGEYDPKWKLRLNSMSLPASKIFKEQFKIEDHEKYIFSYPEKHDDILLFDPVIRKIRKAKQGIVLIKACPGAGKSTLLSYLKDNFYNKTAVFRVKPEHRVFATFTLDVVKCLVNTGLCSSLRPTYKELNNPESAAIFIRKFLCMIQAQIEKKEKKKRGQLVIDRALFLDDLDILPLEDPKFSSFFDNLFLPDLATFKIICSTSGSIPAFFLKLDATSDLTIIHKSDLEFTEDQKIRFLKKIINAEPSLKLALQVFDNCANIPGLVKHFCLNDDALSLGNIAAKTENIDYTDPVAFDYIQTCYKQALSPGKLNIIEKVLVTEYITPEILKTALELLCNITNETDKKAETLWNLMKSLPFLKRISPGLFRIEPTVYKNYSQKMINQSDIDFHSFMLKVGLIYSHMARTGQDENRLKWADQAMICFQKEGDIKKSVEIIKLYSDVLLKKGDIDLLESWLSPLAEQKKLFTPVCYYMGIINHIKGLKGLAVSWFKKAETNELRADDDIRDNSLLAMSLIMQGQLIRESDFENAAVIYDRVIGLADKINDTYTKAVVKGSVGAFFESSRDDEMALAFYNASLDELRLINEPGVEATVLNNIGLLLSRTDRLDESTNSYKEAIELYGRTKNLKAKSSTLYNLANHYQLKGEYITSATLLNQCYDIRVGLNLDDMATEAIIGLAYLHAVTNNFTHALKLIASVDEKLTLSPQRTLSLNLVKGCIASLYMDYMSADEYCRKADSLITSISGNTTGYEWTLSILKARICYLRDDLETASKIIKTILNNKAFMKSPLRKAQAELFMLSLKHKLKGGDIKKSYTEVNQIFAPLGYEGLTLEPCPEFIVLLADLFKIDNISDKPIKIDDEQGNRRLLVKNRLKSPGGIGKHSFIKKLIFSYDPGVIKNALKDFKNKKQKNVDQIIRESEKFNLKNTGYNIISRFMDIKTNQIEVRRLRKEYDSFELFIDMEKGVCYEKKLGFIPLLKKAMLLKLLEYLVSNNGSSITVENIYENVWENEFYGDEDRQNVQMAISRLRSLIEPEKETSKYILLAETKTKTAYRFNSNTRHCLIIKREKTKVEQQN